MIRILALALCVILTPLSFAMAEGIRFTDYELGKKIYLLQQTIDPKGRTILIDGTGTELDGVRIVVPPGAVEREGTIDIGYDTGHIKRTKGAPSGIALCIESKDFNEYLHPLEITIPLTMSATEYRVVLGFMINKYQKLDSAMMTAIDEEKKTVTFITYVPIMMTWVYYQ